MLTLLYCRKLDLSQKPVYQLDLSVSVSRQKGFDLCAPSMRALSDSLSRDYSILFTCPFLRRNQVSAVVRKEFGSKACDRKDLLDIIDEEWNAVRPSHRDQP